MRGFGISKQHSTIFTKIPIPADKAGAKILPAACKSVDKNWLNATNKRQGARADRSPDEAVLLNSKRSISFEKKNIHAEKGMDIIIVSKRAVQEILAIPALFFFAKCPVITGKITPVMEPIIPAGRLKTVMAYPEYAPYSQRAPAIFILSVFFISEKRFVY